MSFSIILTPPTPDEAVLCTEPTVRGLDFISKAAECLRCVIPSKTNQTHQILGRRTTYEILIPDEMAVESGLFQDKNSVYVICPNDGLKNFIFYTADKRTDGVSQTRSRVYPYYRDGVVLKSNIDELAFLDVWARNNFPTSMIGILEGTEAEPTPPTTDGNGTGSDKTPGCGCKFCF